MKVGHQVRQNSGNSSSVGRPWSHPFSGIWGFITSIMIEPQRMVS